MSLHGQQDQEEHRHIWRIVGPTLDFGPYGITPYECFCGARAASDPDTQEIVMRKPLHKER